MKCPLCNKLIPDDEMCPYCEEESCDEFSLDGFSILEESIGKTSKEDSEEDDYAGSPLEAANQMIEKILEENPCFTLITRDEFETTDNEFEFEYQIEDDEADQMIYITIYTKNGKALPPKGLTTEVDGERVFFPFQEKKKSKRKSKSKKISE